MRYATRLQEKGRFACGQIAAAAERLFARAVGVPVAVHAGLLAGGEACEAIAGRKSQQPAYNIQEKGKIRVYLLIGVVHVVGHRIKTRLAGARIPCRRAAIRRRRLRSSVADKVARARAAALEDVVEAQPVADFVGGGRTLVVGGRGAAGERVGEVDAAVEGAVGLAGTRAEARR